MSNARSALRESAHHNWPPPVYPAPTAPQLAWRNHAELLAAAGALSARRTPPPTPRRAAPPTPSPRRRSTVAPALRHATQSRFRGPADRVPMNHPQRDPSDFFKPADAPDLLLFGGELLVDFDDPFAVDRNAEPGSKVTLQDAVGAHRARATRRRVGAGITSEP